MIFVTLMSLSDRRIYHPKYQVDTYDPWGDIVFWLGQLLRVWNIILYYVMYVGKFWSFNKFYYPLNGVEALN